jgi:hypothetical protein
MSARRLTRPSIRSKMEIDFTLPVAGIGVTVGAVARRL